MIRQKNNLSGEKKTNEAISETDGVYNNFYLTRANRRALSMERERERKALPVLGTLISGYY